MLLEDQNPHNKHIMVALLGRPNAGKSSLINNLLGFDLSIVSSKPQTTRNHFNCVVNIDNTEIVMVDTPGLHKSNNELNMRMNGQAKFGSEGVDLNLILLDMKFDINSDFDHFLSTFDNKLTKSWVIFTKSDLVDLSKYDMDKVFNKLKEKCDSLEKYFVISSTEGTNVHLLTGALCDEATPGPHFYPNGEVSNKNERFFVTEYIREQAFHILKEELPYELAVVIDDYLDPKKNDEGKKSKTKISATILVNRPSQRGIVVGKQGSVIKTIGTNARKKIEAMVGDKVNLNLHVKVSPKWFKNNFVLEEIGLPRTQNSARIWRKK